MDDWNNLSETPLLEEDFYSHLNIEDNTDADYVHTKNFEINKFWNKQIGQYHDLYLQSNILLLADVFENFRNLCLKIYEFDPSKFLSAPRLPSPASLKRLK